MLSACSGRMDPRTNILLGPPGTGKTTTLIGLVEEALANGVPPDRIGYVAFTRKASNEAIERACARFNLDPDDLPYFRTLHSLAFRMLGLRSSDLLGIKQIKEFAYLMRIDVSAYMDYSEGQLTWGTKLGDRLMFLENMARVRQVPLKQQWQEAYENFSFTDVEYVARGLEEYKRQHQLLDYTDMLYEFVRAGRLPELDLLVVDEAQDLSALQWRMVERLAETARDVWVAGDDDQAIFRWAGADVDHFISMPGEARVLSQSYRVPLAVQKLALDVVHRIKDRRVKEWKPRQADGHLEFHNHFEHIDMSQGEWLILARNGYQLEPIEEICRREGFIYDMKGGKSVKHAEWRAITAWEKLRRGEAVVATQCREIYEYMTSKKGMAHGHKKLPAFNDEQMLTMDDLLKKGGLLRTDEWYRALDRIDVADREYLRAALRRGEPVRSTPRIRLSTIHGAKGGQAENVMLFTDMAPRTFLESERHPGDEERTFYVGITRAMERLHVILPQTHVNFNLG